MQKIIGGKRPGAPGDYPRGQEFFVFPPSTGPSPGVGGRGDKGKEFMANAIERMPQVFSDGGILLIPSNPPLRKGDLKLPFPSLHRLRENLCSVRQVLQQVIEGKKSSRSVGAHRVCVRPEGGHTGPPLQEPYKSPIKEGLSVGSPWGRREDAALPLPGREGRGSGDFRLELPNWSLPGSGWGIPGSCRFRRSISGAPGC